MALVDYYKILGITQKATTAEIKAAYRKLARKYHPDLHPGDKEAEVKFKEVNEANGVLSDPTKRKKYDAHGEDWKHAEAYTKANQQRQSAYRTAQPNRGGFAGDFSDLFSSMYGSPRNSGSQTQFKGQDLSAELTLNLSDVYKPQKQTLTVNGKKMRLSIPAGIENGQVIRVSGYGTKGTNGGANGDLYITFSILNNTKFKREGKDLYITTDLDLYTALLGGEVLIDTMDGKVKLKIAPETQSGAKIKLRGKGFPVYKKENVFGNLFVTYQLKLPTLLTNKEKELITELQKIRNHETI